jgi:hypothetical protein
MKIKNNIDLLISFIENNYKKYSPSFPPKYKPLKSPNPVNANDYKLKNLKVEKTDLSLYDIKKPQPINNNKKNNNVKSATLIDKKLNVSPKIVFNPQPLSTSVSLKNAPKPISKKVQKNSFFLKFFPFYRSTNKPQQKSKIIDKNRLRVLKRTIGFSAGKF